LQGANIQGAHLREVRNLTVAQIQSTTNYILAELSDQHLQELGLPPDHNEKVGNGDLSHYDLSKLDLRKAELNSFNLEEATFDNTRLEGATLLESNFTQAQLNQACVDEHTKLPKGLTRPEPCPEEKLPQE